MSGKKKRRKKETFVQVYLDGASVCVPKRVDCSYAARGALGVPRGVAVAFAEDPQKGLTFVDGHVFIEGACYVTVDIRKGTKLADGTQITFTDPVPLPPPVAGAPPKLDTEDDDDGLDFTRDPDYWKKDSDDA